MKRVPVEREASVCVCQIIARSIGNRYAYESIIFNWNFVWQRAYICVYANIPAGDCGKQQQLN